jgi:hypothetical protein
MKATKTHWTVKTATGKCELWPSRASARERAQILRRTDGPYHVTVERGDTSDGLSTYTAQEVTE